jgi:hypothetical protein
MKLNVLALALCFVSAGAFLLPDGAQARRFGAGSVHAANAHPNGSWHGAGTRWAGRARPGLRGAWAAGHYGWGAAAGAAAGAALYNSATCYQQQQVWNGFAYVWQTVNVC